MLQLTNVERRYVCVGSGIGIIGYVVVSLIWKRQNMNMRKLKYYHQTVLLLHIKHQIGTYLPLILSSTLTLSGCYIYC